MSGVGLDVTDADFTPNPDRAIWIQGEFNGALLDRLRPEILELISCSRDPITVYIDSEGGSPAVGESILSLLRSPNQDDSSACRIITVAVSKACSAAADLLSAGDFAIAHPGSRLLCHNAGFPRSRANDAPYTGLAERLPEAVLGEWSRLTTEILTASNERSATALALNSARRFPFIVFALRARFEQHRAEANESTLTDLRCFEEILCQRVSPGAQKVLRQAAAIWSRRYPLVTHFEEEVARVRPCREAEIERLMLDESISFEFENNKTELSLRKGGLSRITDDFFFLDACFRGTHGVQFTALCERYAPEEQEEKFRAYFLPFWSFFVALCGALHRGENELTAKDALWLSLVDTVQADNPALSAS